MGTCIQPCLAWACLLRKRAPRSFRCEFSEPSMPGRFTGRFIWGAKSPSSSASRFISRAQILRQAEKIATRSEEHTSELQSQSNLVCRLLLEKKKKKKTT